MYEKMLPEPGSARPNQFRQVDGLRVYQNRIGRGSGRVEFLCIFNRAIFYMKNSKSYGHVPKLRIAQGGSRVYKKMLRFSGDMGGL